MVCLPTEWVRWGERYFLGIFFITGGKGWEKVGVAVGEVGTVGPHRGHVSSDRRWVTCPRRWVQVGREVPFWPCPGGERWGRAHRSHHSPPLPTVPTQRAEWARTRSLTHGAHSRPTVPTVGVRSSPTGATAERTHLVGEPHGSHRRPHHSHRTHRRPPTAPPGSALDVERTPGWVPTVPTLPTTVHVL